MLPAHLSSQVGHLSPPHSLSGGKVWLVLSHSSAFLSLIVIILCVYNLKYSFLVYVLTQSPNVVRTS